MAMAKNAEKLIILGDVCRGLLARVYNLLGKKPTTLTADVDKVCKLLIKKFPDHPNDLDKVQGNDLFNKRAQEIETELQDVYLTYLDVMNFNDAAWKLLPDMAKSIVNFKLEVNVDLMVLYMDLFVSYVQLHLLLSRVEDSKLLLSAYARAYNQTHGNTEPNFLRIANYVEQYANPIAKLRDQCTELELSIGDTLSNFFMPLSKWVDPKFISEKNIFTILDHPKDMAAESASTDLIEIINFDKLQLWSIYGYLICPIALEKPNALQVLQLCLADHFVAPVYRDQNLSIHEEFSALFDDFKRNKFKLSKHKKILKEAREDALATVDRHADARKRLRLELNTLLHFFSEFPTLVAPKVQMILCGLRLARNEIVWYFRHQSVQPYKPKKFISKPEDFLDPLISELIYLVDQVNSLVMMHKPVIRQYFAEQIQQVDSKNLQAAIESFTRNAKLTHDVSNLLQEILNAVSRASVDDNFEPLRLNWYRVSAIINSQQSSIPPTVAGPLNAAMTAILNHTRHVDRVEAQLKTHASMMWLFFWKSQLYQLLQTMMQSVMGQPRHCVAVLKLCSAALENVHQICPEEQKLLGTQAAKTAEIYLAHICSSVERLVIALTNKLFKLRAKLAPSEVVTRWQRQLENKGQADPLPGYESLYRCKPAVAEMRHWQKIVQEVAEAFRRVDKIVVYNTEFVPREFLHEAVSTSVSNAIKRLSMLDRRIQRPSAILTQIKDLVYAFATIDRHANLNLSDLVREVLQQEFCDNTNGSVGEPVLVDDTIDEKKEERLPAVVHVMSTWYVKELLRAHEAGIIYSQLKRSFVTLPTRVDRSEPFAAAEYYFDTQELISLCTLIGPSGVRVFEKDILAAVSNNIREIHQILRKNFEVLKAMNGKFSEKNIWLETVNKLNDLDRLVKHSVQVGLLLKFRKMLREALREVCRDTVPFVFNGVRNLFSQYPPNVAMEPALAPLDLAAHDVGVDVGLADHSLVLILKKFRQKTEEATVWALLPELFGCCYIANMWKESAYLIEHEAHANNVHCLATCINALISALACISVVESKNEDLDLRILMDLERFLRCSASTILHMNAAKGSENFSGFPMPSIFVFPEIFVRESPSLSLSMLEDFMPFTLLRTNYIQMYEKQSVKGKSYAAVADEEKE